MKKILSCVLALALLAVCWVGALPAAAAGTLSVSAGAGSVKVGETVTVTLNYSGGDAGIASIDASVTYDTAVFQYVSCAGNNVTANGGAAGQVRLSYFSLDLVAAKTAQAVLTFKAVGAGSCQFAVATGEFTADTDGYPSLGTPSASATVGVVNPQLSSNANLSSLKLSSGTLSPAFSADKTEYTATVPYSVTSVSVSATPQDKDAKTAISGKDALSVGKNTRVVTVTAANGGIKKYTVVITRSGGQTTAPKDTPKTTTTTAPKDPPLEVTAEGKTWLLSRSAPGAEPPAGFSAWQETPYGEANVPGAVNEANQLTLVYLIEKAPETEGPDDGTTEEKTEAPLDEGFFIMEDGAFIRYRPVTTIGGVYAIDNLPEDLAKPYGTVETELTFSAGVAGVVTTSALEFEDKTLAAFRIVYATAPNGNRGLYLYDSEEGTLQRFFETPRDETETVETEPETEPIPVLAFLETNRTPLLIAAAVLGGLALLIGAIVLLVSAASGSKKGRH